MSDLFEYVHTEGDDPRFNMPYTPAIKITGGRVVYLAAVTAAPVYHSHPPIASEFHDIPLDPEEQTEMCMGNLRRWSRRPGGASTPSSRSPAIWSTRPATRTV